MSNDPRTSSSRPLPPMLPGYVDAAPAAWHAAARGVWITAGVLVAVSGCCGTLVGVAAMMPADLMAQTMREAAVPADMRPMMRTFFTVAAVLMFVLVFLPGLVLAVLGGAVWACKRWAAKAATALASALAALAGVLVLMSLLSVITAGDVSALLGAALWGLLVALLVWCVRLLRFALRFPTADGPPTRFDPDDDPWEATL